MNIFYDGVYYYDRENDPEIALLKREGYIVEFVKSIHNVRARAFARTGKFPRIRNGIQYPNQLKLF